MRRITVTVTAATLLAAGLPVYAQAQEQKLPAQYADQTITWGPCADIANSEALECGTFRSPRDWNRVGDGKKITIAVSRLKRTTPAKTSVLTNPGGPGAPGRDLPLAFTDHARLVDNVELVGIDVRGTGASTNLTCGGFNHLDVTDPRDRSKANLKLLYDAAEFEATSCQVKGGEYGAVVNTEQTVKDLDLLRHLLGREKISWLGYSGGTWMGAYYATYFPNRVDRFVLDSNTNFVSTWQDVFDNFPYAFERRFRTDFTPWVAKYDGLYHLGGTAEQVRQTYEATRAKLVTNPIRLPGGTLFDGPQLDFVLIGGMYSKYNFATAAQTLAQAGSESADTQALAGAVAAVAKAGAADPQYADAADATGNAILCNDTKFNGNRQYLVNEANRLGKQYPLIGYYQITAACAFWDRPALQLRKPTGKGVPPVLMVQTERDPATPIEGAREAHAKFAGSRLLTVKNEGDHGAFGFGNKCVDDIVEAYLVDGKVPTKDLTCEGIGLPDPTAPSAKRSATTTPVLPRVF
ncbi:alpha/beta hydrolase [Actinosynnema sp. NPDC020468]|uniref:alpha/beta hydrolase n=1 Tax=Actinosynnema sp. NPDC020468 TaxID=3154488 RepID=UPI003402672D